MSFHKPTNVAPFKSVIRKLVRLINQRCIYEKAWDTRLYFPHAWAYFLLWDFRAAPLHADGFRIIDINGVNKYPNYKKIKHSKIALEDTPTNWVELGIESLIDNEIIFDNYKQGERRRFRPSKLLMKYWDEVTTLEQRYDPYSSKDILLNIQVVQRIRRIERVLREVCKLIGIDFKLT